MNWDQINSNWKRASARIKAAWAKLTGHDASETAGQTKLEPIPIGDKQ